MTRETVPTEVVHYALQPTIELAMGVSGRDLGHVSDDVAKVLDSFGIPDTKTGGEWFPYDPGSTEKRRLMCFSSCDRAVNRSATRSSATTRGRAAS